MVHMINMRRVLCLFALLAYVIAGKCGRNEEKKCPGPNEFYTCGSACQTECATLNKPCGIVNKKCNLGCYCEEGYARNDKGICIPKGRCPPICDRPNEEYHCGGACQTRCDNYGLECPIQNIVCNDWCYCKEGYARNGSDTASCIPYELCPK